jgi:hypothetical protein
MPDSHLPPDRKTFRELRESVDHNNELLEPMLQGFEDLAKATRANRILSALLVMALLAVCGLGYWQLKVNHENQVSACQIGNDRVERERVWWRDAYFVVTKESAKAQGFEKGSPIQDYYDALEDYRLTDLLPLRDCDNLDQQLPAWGDPPDFHEALKQAIEDEKKNNR